MHPLHPIATDGTFGREFIRRRVKRRSHRIGQRLLGSSRDQPSTTVVDQLGDARDGRADDRAPQRQRLHDDHRQPFGKARQDERAAPLEMIANLGGGPYSGEGDYRSEIATGDIGLEPIPHLADPHDGQSEWFFAGAKPIARRDQQRQPLLRRKAADTQELGESA